MSKIELKKINKYYGDNHVLKDLTLTIEDGDFMTLLGPSGCGKTTTLRVVSGLERPQGGVMLIDGKEAINAEKAFYLEPSKRGLNLVFQSYALWPHMTVFENIAFGLKIQKLPKSEVEKRVRESLKMMRISEFEKRYPNELSGGQQQRVAIARAVASNPRLLLLDEPLSNLDAKLRVQMRTEIRRIQQALGITAIYVTHDQSEAMAISDNIILMKGGVIAQMGSPTEIYYHPNSEFVADFIGECNFLPCTVTGREGNDVIADVYGHPVKVLSERDTIGSAEIVLRPEAIEIADQGQLPCKVELSCFMGSYQNYHVRVGDTLVKIADNCPIGRKTYQVGDEAYISFRSECAHLLAT